MVCRRGGYHHRPMDAPISPLLTLPVHLALMDARAAGAERLICSLDLDRTQTEVSISATDWRWQGVAFPYMDDCRDRTIYHASEGRFVPVSRFSDGLIKLVPTDWGAPTFEIDGIKMLPTARVSPYADAQRKVGLIEPRGKTVLDTCGGLGYFAAWCPAGSTRSGSLPTERMTRQPGWRSAIRLRYRLRTARTPSPLNSVANPARCSRVATSLRTSRPLVSLLGAPV